MDMIQVAIIVEKVRQTLLSTQISINQRQVFVDCKTVVSTLKKTHRLISVVTRPQVAEKCCNNVIFGNGQLKQLQC